MARNRKKKALYEVIGKTWSKPVSGGAVGRLHPEKTDEGERDEQTTTEATGWMPEKLTRWPKKPRIVQINAGRIELSMPYQLAIALLLGLILVVLVVFRLGQISRKAADSVGQLPGSRSEAAGRATAGTAQTPDMVEVTTRAPVSARGVEAAQPRGDNAIVLVEYGRRADLVPVQQHFAEYGIETEIVLAANGRYFLWTRQRYENIDTPGTDGYTAKQRIVEVGARYKGRAPEGYESFAPHFFRDAYGKKVK